MARYLLGTQCLLDVALFNQGAAHRWFSSKEPQTGLFVGDVAISAFSVALIRAFYKANPPTIAKEIAHKEDVEKLIHKENVEKLIRQFEVANAIEGASPAVISFWEVYATTHLAYDIPQKGSQRLGLEERMVLATAVHGNHGRGFILVDRKQAVHETFGIIVVDPYAIPSP